MSASPNSTSKRLPAAIDPCDTPALKKHCPDMSASKSSSETAASADEDMEICSNSNGDSETCKRQSDFVINMHDESEILDVQNLNPSDSAMNNPHSSYQEDIEDSFVDQNDSTVNVIDESSSFDEDEEEREEENVPDKTSNAVEHEPEEQSWRGTSIVEITPQVPLSELPRVFPSFNHKVMYRLPFKPTYVPKPEPQDMQDFWIQDHVRMPYSAMSKYPVRGVPDSFGNRWNMIKEALKRPINTMKELEAAILSYNHTYGNDWDFSLLHFLFNEEYTEEETQAVFDTILPGIIELAIRLPSIVTQPIPLLKAGMSFQLSLSQLQIASLLANAFLCTFPRRNSASRKPTGEFSNYPPINFNGLYKISNERSTDSSLGKLKCLLNYFRRITTETPQGTVTFSRRNMNRDAMPHWSDSNKKLTKLHVTSTGTIEDDGINMLQVDFANRMIGGGVLGSGCVQEEIRFVICPELIVSRLFTECLSDNEALVISGVERFSNYQGYARTFEFDGDYTDGTSRDASGRRHCSIVAIDALQFHSRIPQFHPNKINRELNKAFVGFHAQEPVKTRTHSPHSPHKSMPIATGNWGCGAFQGDKHLKAILQILAAAQAGRDVAYFTFNDRCLRNEIAELHNILRQHDVSVGQVYRALLHYHANYLVEGRLTCSLFKYLLAKFTPGATVPKISRPITDYINYSRKKNSTEESENKNRRFLSDPTQDNSPRQDISSDSVLSILESYDTNEGTSNVPNKPSTSVVPASKPSKEESLTEHYPFSGGSSLQTNDESSQIKKEKHDSSPKASSLNDSKFVEQNVTKKNTTCDSNSSNNQAVKVGSSTNKTSDEVLDRSKNNSTEMSAQKNKITDYFSRQN